MQHVSPLDSTSEVLLNPVPELSGRLWGLHYSEHCVFRDHTQLAEEHGGSIPAVLFLDLASHQGGLCLSYPVQPFLLSSQVVPKEGWGKQISRLSLGIRENLCQPSGHQPRGSSSLHVLTPFWACL